MLPSCRATHHNGTATSTPEKVSTVRGRGMRLVMTNHEAIGGNMLEVSFDAGKTYFSIPPQTMFREPITFHEFYVKGSGAYSALLFEA